MALFKTLLTFLFDCFELTYEEENSLEESRVTYQLEKHGTRAGVGWFKCEPKGQWEVSRALEYLEDHPFDLFMHNYALEKLGSLEPEEFNHFAEQNREAGLPLRALIYEAYLRNWKFEASGIMLQGLNLRKLAEHSPVIDVRWNLAEHQEQNRYWLKCFASNFYRHTEMPEYGREEYPLPIDREGLTQAFGKSVHISDIAVGRGRTQKPSDRHALKSFAKDLTRKLEGLSILTGWETRTEATLSPFAVERPWLLNTEVEDGRNSYKLEGMQISYGRGLNLYQAKISCLMEVVERCSAFASVKGGRLDGYETLGPLKKASYDEMVSGGLNAIDPNELSLEVRYDGYPLTWIKGEEVSSKGQQEVYVPAQLVFLFSNFDEISLTSGVSSTGLGAGRDLDEAKLSALLEVIERDSEKVVPYTRTRCFRLDAEDPKVSDLLVGWDKRGIYIHLCDLSSEFGIPCYKAFICGPGGVILKGTAANLDGKRAIVSAITEIPYPYPYWFGSMEPMEGIPVLEYEDLPNYSTGDTKGDLALLHDLLIKNGYSVIYVNLTKKLLGVPVVRALVPGLEFMTFFDRFTPLCVRQFAHYLRLKGS